MKATKRLVALFALAAVLAVNDHAHAILGPIIRGAAAVGGRVLQRYIHRKEAKKIYEEFIKKHQGVRDRAQQELSRNPNGPRTQQLQQDIREAEHYIRDFQHRLRTKDFGTGRYTPR